MSNFAYTAQTALRINTRGLNKPNEDYIICDPERGIFIVLDGVTRQHGEYTEGCSESAALDVSVIFGNALHEQLVATLGNSDEDIEALIFSAAAFANHKVQEYNNSKTREEWYYYPGTVGIAGVIKNGILHYGYIGDCLGLLIRNGTKIFFTEQQSRHSLYIENRTKELLYGSVCNHKETRFSYGVITGEETAMDFFWTCRIALEPDDVVILSSDGADRYLIFEPAENILKNDPSEILEASVEYDVPPYGNYSDDKAIITISGTEQV